MDRTSTRNGDEEGRKQKTRKRETEKSTRKTETEKSTRKMATEQRTRKTE